MKSLKLLILAFLLSSLVGCVKTVYIQKTVPVVPPTAYLRDCTVYGLEGKSVADALRQSLKNKKSLQDCNSDKKAIRDWLRNTPKEEVVDKFEK